MARHFIQRIQPHWEPKRPNSGLKARHETKTTKNTREGKDKARRRSRPPGGGREPTNGTVWHIKIRRRFRLSVSRSAQGRSMSCGHDDDVYDHIGERLKLEGETRAMIEERTMGDG